MDYFITAQYHDTRIRRLDDLFTLMQVRKAFIFKFLPLTAVRQTISFNIFRVKCTLVI